MMTFSPRPLLGLKKGEMPKDGHLLARRFDSRAPASSVLLVRCGYDYAMNEQVNTQIAVALQRDWMPTKM